MLRCPLAEYPVTPRLLFAVILVVSPLLGCPPATEADDDDSAVGNLDRLVTVETTLGSFGIALFMDEAPLTAANFLDYVEEGFYDGSDGLGATIFHRVVADFVVQGGGFTAAGVQKNTHPPVVNEATTSGLSNTRATVAMARTSDPDSATCQFFVNLVDNSFLDPGQSTPEGYAVFGLVTRGIDVVDAIGRVDTGGGEQPIEDVVITSLTRD